MSGPEGCTCYEPEPTNDGSEPKMLLTQNCMDSKAAQARNIKADSYEPTTSMNKSCLGPTTAQALNLRKDGSEEKIFEPEKRCTVTLFQKVGDEDMF